MTLDELQDWIHLTGDEWAGRNKFEQPNEFDAVAFMTTEAAEALDKAMSAKNSGFVRNNPDKVRTWAKVDEEAADTIIMALRYFARRGVSAQTEVVKKIQKMDEKRRG